MSGWYRNTIEFLGIWEPLNNPGFNPIEFDGIGTSRACPSINNQRFPGIPRRSSGLKPKELWLAQRRGGAEEKKQRLSFNLCALASLRESRSEQEGEG